LAAADQVQSRLVKVSRAFEPVSPLGYRRLAIGYSAPAADQGRSRPIKANQA
jgi:hypothetical protein